MRTPLVRVVAATRVYGQTRALDNVSLELKPGEVTGLIGANGAGKTTLMRAIVGLLSLDSGRVEILMPPGERLGIGYLPEERGLYPRQPPLKTLEYLALLRGFSDGDASRAARAWIDRIELPDAGTRRLEQFSKGQQQKVQLAAACLGDPAVLLLDEPFSGLDPLNVRLVGEIVREATARRAAVLLSAHQLALVESVCEQIVMLRHGRVAVAGPMREIVASVTLESLFEAPSVTGGEQ